MTWRRLAACAAALAISAGSVIDNPAACAGLQDVSSGRIPGFPDDTCPGDTPIEAPAAAVLSPGFAIGWVLMPGVPEPRSAEAPAPPTPPPTAAA